MYKGYKLRQSDDGAYTTSKSRPYDDAEYYWAFSKDCERWGLAYKSKVKFKMIGNFEQIVDRLEELNADIKPIMCRD